MIHVPFVIGTQLFLRTEIDIANIFYFLTQNLNWKFSKGNESIGPYQIVKKYSIASALPKPCYTHLQEEFSSFSTKIDGGLYFLTEYTAQQLSGQLTLLEQVKWILFYELTMRYTYRFLYWFVFSIMQCRYYSAVKS